MEDLTDVSALVGAEGRVVARFLIWNPLINLQLVTGFDTTQIFILELRHQKSTYIEQTVSNRASHRH